MVTDTTGHERVRAWLLATAEDPESAATALYSKLGYEGGDEWVVVRADFVEGAHDIVIPVDAASEDALMAAVERIESLNLLEEITMLRVRVSVPFPPHVANGYVTHGELAEQHAKGIDIGEYIRAGRQGHSPGFNAWG